MNPGSDIRAVAEELRRLARVKWSKPTAFEPFVQLLAMTELSLDAEASLASQVACLREMLTAVVEDLAADEQEEGGSRSVALGAQILYRLDRGTADQTIGERQRVIASRWNVDFHYFRQTLERDVHEAVAAKLCAQETAEEELPEQGGEPKLFEEVAQDALFISSDLREALRLRQLNSPEDQVDEALQTALWQLVCPRPFRSWLQAAGLTLLGGAKDPEQFLLVEALLLSQFLEPQFRKRQHALLLAIHQEEPGRPSFHVFLERLEGTPIGVGVLGRWREWALSCTCDVTEPEDTCPVHAFISMLKLASELADSEAEALSSARDEIERHKKQLIDRLSDPQLAGEARAAPPALQPHVSWNSIVAMALAETPGAPAPYPLRGIARMLEPGEAFFPTTTELVLVEGARVESHFLYEHERNVWSASPPR